MNNSSNGHQPLVLDLKQAATYSGLSYWTLYDLAKSGLIPTVRIPDTRKPGKFQRRILFTRVAIDEFISKHEGKKWS